ncbi:5-dehydro-4-deoxy-D-glucuronate isomerase [Aliiglaciecola sp. SL4]|uniref:5-dehydro-4-deoxy-D-glucuronate isomerase n=1 Tax=Aliiglaciecola sp. SL4 TaxID=3239806 RepID=UPI00355BC112
MDLRVSADNIRYKRMTSSELRSSFLVDNLFIEDEVPMTYSDIDRGVVASAVPVNKALELPVHKELACTYFTQRREVGVLNIGGKGKITINQKEYPLAFEDSLYIGRGNEEITFESEDSNNPAKFYIVSYPAHKEYPTKLITKSMAKKIEMGSMETSNKRTIYQAISPDNLDTCQIVMGFTSLEPGSVWNTMAPHTHRRRSEYYMYYTLSPENIVFHFMGESDNVRPLVMRNQQVALSPSWSIHSGCGTNAYTFCWAMGGENQEFTDMDHLTVDEIF